MGKISLAQLKNNAKGQSLVELAITAPLLIFMLIGLFEVGWVLRSYLVLVNVNREVTRFSIRPGYLDFSNGRLDPDSIGYDEVLANVYTVLGRNPTDPVNSPGQLPLDFSADPQKNNATLIISHLVVDTGHPCDPESDIALCNCDEFLNPGSNFNAAQNFTYDDLILHPTMPRQAFNARTYPATSTVTTAFSYTQKVAELAHQNNKFNCELLKKGGGAVPSANNVIITELFYEQPQLFGFPLISNPLTDPVPLYTHTIMRMISGRNENTGIVGPVCNAYPIIVSQTTIGGRGPDNQVNVLEGWVRWNSTAPPSEEYLKAELQYSRMSINDYQNPTDAADTYLNIGDWVVREPPGSYTDASIQALVEELVGEVIILPVYNNIAGSNYQINNFVRVRIESKDDVDLSTGTILATYLDEAQSCQ